jgi:hypothetical protein
MRVDVGTCFCVFFASLHVGAMELLLNVIYRMVDGSILSQLVDLYYEATTHAN